MQLPLFRTKTCQIIFRSAYAVSRKSWGGIRISETTELTEQLPALDFLDGQLFRFLLDGHDKEDSIRVRRAVQVPESSNYRLPSMETSAQSMPNTIGMLPQEFAYTHGPFGKRSNSC